MHPALFPPACVRSRHGNEASRKFLQHIDIIKDVQYNVHGGDDMQNTNATNFRRNLFGMLEKTIKYGEPLNISTRDGNAVVMSEEDYDGLIATLELLSTPQMRTKLLKGKETPLSECVDESEVQW